MVNKARSIYIEWRENSNIAHLKNRSVFLLLLMAIISSFTEIIGIGMFYPIFSVIGQDNNEELNNSDSIISNIPASIFDYTGIHISLGYLLIIVIFLFLFRQLVMYIKSVYAPRVLYTVRKNLIDKMFSLFLRSSTSFHDSMSIGKFSNILSKEVHATALGIMAPIELIINIVMLLVLLFALLLVSWELTLFTVFILIISVIISKIWVSKSEKVGKDLVGSNNELNAFLIERVKSPRLVRLSRTESVEFKAFKLLSRLQRDHTIHTSVLMSRTNMVFEPILISMISLFLYISYSILNLRLDDIGVYIILSLRILPAMKSAVLQWQRIKSLKGSVDLVKNNITNMTRSLENYSGGIMLNKVRGSINFKGVSYRYHNSDVNSLHNINLSIAAGSLNALVGPSGSGKSTFIDLLPRLRQPNSGEIVLDGISIEQLEIESLRSSIAYAPQSPQIFSGTIMNHICYGSRDCTIDSVRKAANLVGVSEFIESLPDNYYTLVGEEGMGLSGGQRQLIDLARVIVSNSPIIILDEPSSSLDVESEHKFYAAIKGIHRELNSTIIYITHKLNRVRFMDNIIVLNKGSVIENGTHEELINNNNWYANAVNKSV